MLLISDKPYSLRERDSNKAKLEVLLQTTLSGGTANYYVRDKDATDFSLVKALTDVPTLGRVPSQGDFKVTTTGSAVVYGDIT
jgi:hypothetical protein